MPILNWIGKDKVINHHLDIPFHTLKEEYKFGSNSPALESLGETNKIIHADNLLALKSLLPQYEGKIKCIYIDPPYNTGNEGWVYNDNVNDPKFKKWLKAVVGKEGEDLTRHDKWLCMMYPRLKLLHKLLADDGAIFISIDDNEQASLKLICDEIFGAGNYLGLISRKQSSGSKNDTGNNKVITTTDYILPYKKNGFTFLPYQIKNNKSFNLKDDNGSFSIRALEMQGGGDTLPLRNKMGYSIYFNKDINKTELLFDYNLENNPVYEVENNELLLKGYKCYRPRKRGNELGIWRWGAETFLERFNNGLVHFDKHRVYMRERETEFVNKYPEALIENYLNTEGTNELKKIFDTKTFDFPKPSELIKFICSVSTDKNSIILDSFAGSGTTAHAVLNLNKQDGGNRKFILIEMEDYANSITAERVKRVIDGYADIEGTGGSFTYYTLGERVMDDEGNLNPHLALAKIHQYLWYADTHTTYNGIATPEGYLGKHIYTGIYFNYKPNEVTVLNEAYLMNVKELCEQYIMYADMCLLPETLLQKHNIIFKKIPRDISKL